MYNSDIILDVAAGVILGGFVLMFFLGAIMQVTESGKRPRLIVTRVWQSAIVGLAIMFFMMWRFMSR